MHLRVRGAIPEGNCQGNMHKRLIRTVPYTSTHTAVLHPPRTQTTHVHTVSYYTHAHTSMHTSPNDSHGCPDACSRVSVNRLGNWGSRDTVVARDCTFAAAACSSFARSGEGWYEDAAPEPGPLKGANRKRRREGLY